MYTENINYYTFNGNNPTKPEQVHKLISARDGIIKISPMWRMEMLGKYYGIDILSFCQEEFRPYDIFDCYFEDLAYLADQLYCPRAAIKCLIKALYLKYKSARVSCGFPHDSFYYIYNRLMDSHDKQQEKIANRLHKDYLKQCEDYCNWKSYQRDFD